MSWKRICRDATEVRERKGRKAPWPPRELFPPQDLKGQGRKPASELEIREDEELRRAQPVPEQDKGGHAGSITSVLYYYRADRQRPLEFNGKIPRFLLEGLSFLYPYPYFKPHNRNLSTLFICSLSSKGKLQNGSRQREDYGLHLINGYFYVLSWLWGILS